MTRPPFSVRHDPKQLEDFYVLRKGVPDGLLQSLLDWVEPHYCYRGWLRADDVGRLERITGMQLSRRASDLMYSFRTDHVLLINAVDLALAIEHDPEDAAGLSRMLAEARSEYTVGADENGDYELQFRQPVELTQMVEAATSDANSASHHLRQAWSQAFGREPEPTAACDEAVRAIEAAAKPVVTPNDSLATLGKMITAMRDAPNKWTTDSNASDDVNAVIAMMDLVWKGYRRHGNPSQPAEATVETAQMLVQSAALLVHWFQSGHIRGVP